MCSTECDATEEDSVKIHAWVMHVFALQTGWLLSNMNAHRVANLADILLRDSILQSYFLNIVVSNLWHLKFCNAVHQLAMVSELVYQLGLSVRVSNSSFCDSSIRFFIVYDSSSY